jgi:hypothetical protein
MNAKPFLKISASSQPSVGAVLFANNLKADGGRRTREVSRKRGARIHSLPELGSSGDTYIHVHPHTYERESSSRAHQKQNQRDSKCYIIWWEQDARKIFF